MPTPVKLSVAVTMDRKVTFDEWLEDMNDELQHIHNIIQEYNDKSGYRILDCDLADFAWIAYQNSTLYNLKQRKYYINSEDEDNEDDLEYDDPT